MLAFFFLTKNYQQSSGELSFKAELWFPTARIKHKLIQKKLK